MRIRTIYHSLKRVKLLLVKSGIMTALEKRTMKGTDKTAVQFLSVGPGGRSFDRPVADSEPSGGVFEMVSSFDEDTKWKVTLKLDRTRRPSHRLQSGEEPLIMISTNSSRI